MGLLASGSYYGLCSAGEDILESIWQDIKDVTGNELSKPLRLRHVRIKSDPDTEFIMNKFTYKTDEFGIFCTPNNDKGNLLEIYELVSNQPCEVEIYYLR